MQRYIFILFVLLCISNLQAADLRSWVGSNGKTIEAEFVSYDNDNEIVIIKRADGKEQRVKLSLFSGKDQDYAKSGGKINTDDPFGDAEDNLTDNKKVPKLSPSNRDNEITKAMIKLLNEKHIFGKVFDKKLGEQSFENYIKVLDPMKTYFLQSDIDGFRNEAGSLANQVTEGNASLGFNIYNRYLQRINDAVDIMLEILHKPLNFNVDEEYVLDKDSLSFPKNNDELKDRLRKKVKYDVLQLKDNTAKDDPVERMKRRYENLRKTQFQSTNDDVLETFLTAIGRTFDPWMSYVSLHSTNQMNQKLEGIGATLTSEDGITIITKLVPGGPAERSGKLNADDKIIGVGQGQNGKIEDVFDQRLQDVVKLIRGEKNTIVRLEILDKNNKNKIVELTRDVVNMDDSKAKSEIFDVGNKKIGVIRIPDFYPGVINEVKEMLRQFNQKNIDACIVDLSFNGGGQFGETLNFVGLFIETGSIVQLTERGKIAANTRNDSDPSMEWKKPLVLLSNKWCAVEIVLGSLQDFRRALIIGDTVSQGKETAQQMLNVKEFLYGKSSDKPNMGTVKFACSVMYSPNGKPLDGTKSDIVLPSLSELMDITIAHTNIPLDKIPPVREFPTFPFVSPEIIKTLSEKSAARIKKSKDFAELQKEMNQIKLSRERKSVPLNEKKYIEEAKKYQSTDDKAIFERRYSGSKIVKDFYLDEVLAITADYVNLLP